MTCITFKLSGVGAGGGGILRSYRTMNPGRHVTELRTRAAPATRQKRKLLKSLSYAQLQLNRDLMINPAAGVHQRSSHFVTFVMSGAVARMSALGGNGYLAREAKLVVQAAVFPDFR